MKSICLFILLTANTFVAGQQPNHKLWNQFLKTYVSAEGNVNYQIITKKPEDLKAYLNELVSSQPKPNWSKNDLLAYWINAYNAYTLKIVTDHYPVKSIKDITNVWDLDFIPYNGKLISLNHIEHNILRQMEEPRIHFAIVCASVSCPKLQNEAYTANEIDEQLTKATKEFLIDSSKNKITKDRVELSKIFRWFRKDFEIDARLIDFLNRYSNVKILDRVNIQYLDYNWDLND